VAHASGGDGGDYFVGTQPGAGSEGREHDARIIAARLRAARYGWATPRERRPLACQVLIAHTSRPGERN
jgi:hypothetical protein